MKDFFWKRIYPYAQDTIRQSELLSSICQLPSEPLRAFFFLKVSQALQQKASISMMVQVLPEEWQAGMDPIDLTRILGILMDNAIEEALLVPGGMIEIRITGKPYGCSYTIRNSVTRQTMQRGVHTGESTKGNGRGRGLAIVQELLEAYRNAALNSCLLEDTFIQSLTLSWDHPLS